MSRIYFRKKSIALFVSIFILSGLLPSTTSFDVVAAESNIIYKDGIYKYDFGTDKAEKGYVAVTTKTLFDTNKIFGLVLTNKIDVKKSNSVGDLKSDGLMGKDIEFKVTLPNDTYNVTVICENINKDLIVNSEGIDVYNGNNFKDFFEKSFETEVKDGQLNLLFKDESVVNAIEISKIVKFDLGSEGTTNGYIKVSSKNSYTSSKGYGFSDTSNVEDGFIDDMQDAVARDFVAFKTGGYDTENFFKVDLLPGRYQVSFVTGGNKSNRVGIYANSLQRVMSIDTGEKRTQKEKFTVSTSDGKIAISMSGRGMPVALNEIEFKKIADNIEIPKTIYILGDSTVCTYYTNTPKSQAGWGEFLNKFVSPDIFVMNFAEGGMALKSLFTQDHSLSQMNNSIIESLQPGDYLLIGFGINDANKDPNRYTRAGEEFDELLKIEVAKAKEKGAIPIFVTTQGRSGNFTKTEPIEYKVGNGYAAAMRNVASTENVKVIDLEKRSSEYYTFVGPDITREFYISDGLHLNHLGGTQLARCVAYEANDLALDWFESISKQILEHIPFSDVDNHWAKKEITQMNALGVIKGVRDGEFEPEGKITRAEFLALITRTIGLKPVKYNGGYTDIKEDNWYADTFQAAYDEGIINNQMLLNKKFNPDEFITRQEMTSLIVGAYKSMVGDINKQGSLEGFYDKDQIQSWTLADVKDALGLEVIKGISETSFAPKENATRAQAAVITKRLYDKIAIGLKEKEQAAAPKAQVADESKFIKGGSFSLNGPWTESILKGSNTLIKTYYSTDAKASAKWSPDIKEKCKVKIFVYRLSYQNNIIQKYEIVHNGKKDEALIDFKLGEPGWVELGDFDFSGTNEEYVNLVEAPGTKRVAEIRFEFLDGTMAGKSIVVEQKK